MLDKLIHKFLGVPYALHIGYDRPAPKKPEKSTIIFLHGLATDSESWSAVISDLEAKSEYDHTRLICIDLLGFGNSPAPDWSNYDINDHTRAIAKTIRRLRIKSPIIITAHSMGSLLAIEYVTHHFHKVKQLLLVSPPFLRPYHENLIDRFYKTMFRKLRRHAKSRPIRFFSNIVGKISTFRSHALRTRAFRRSLTKVIVSGRVWYSIAALDVPTHIIAGILDPLVARSNIDKLKKNPHITVSTHFVSHDIAHSCRAPIKKHLTTIMKDYQ